MIVIGVDTHKRSHTMVALDAASGTTRGQLTIAASDEGTLDAWTRHDAEKHAHVEYPVVHETPKVAKQST